MGFVRTARLFFALLLVAPLAYAQVDLSINKSGPPAGVRGDNVDFTIDVTNLSASASGAVTVSDPITSGWSFVSVVPAAGFSCTDPGSGATSGTVTCTAGSIPASATRTFLVTLRITPGTPIGTILTNTATVSSPTDTNSNNDSSSAQVEVVASADLSILKTGPATALADTDVMFNIAIMNNGPDDSGPLSMSDPVVGGWSFVSATWPNDFSCNTPNVGDTTGSVSCFGSNLAAGATANFTITFHIPPGTPQGTFFSNTASVNAESDPNSENNSSTATTSTPPPPQADIGIIKDGPSTAIPDSDVSYTITVTNSGPDAGADVNWTDTLPGTMTFVSLNQNSGPTFNCTAPPVNCTIATFPAGSTAVFTLVGHIPPGTQSGTDFTNQASVTTKTVDPNGENNLSTTTLTVSSADVSVIKSGPPTATTGGNITYTITVTNAGPDVAAGVLLSDTLPPTTTLVSFTQNNGAPANCLAPLPGNSGTVDCNWTSLGPGSAQFTLVVATTAPGTVSNTATVNSQSGDPNPNNNSSNVQTVVTSQVDVSVGKTGPANAGNGGAIQYQITVANAGPSPATNVALTDATPANTTFVSFNQQTGPAFNCTAPPVNCTIATLASGASATFVLNVIVNQTTPPGTVITNTANVTSSPTDTNTNNNTASVTTTTTATATDVAITKSAAPGLYATDGPVTWNLTVTNNGPATAFNVTVTDPLVGNTVNGTPTASQGSCSGTTTITCTLGTLAAGASATITINATFGSTPGTVSNTAAVTMTNTDTNPTNNSSTTTVTVLEAARIPALSNAVMLLLGAAMAALALLAMKR